MSQSGKTKLRREARRRPRTAKRPHTQQPEKVIIKQNPVPGIGDIWLPPNPQTGLRERDPERIGIVLRALDQLWRKNPQQRLTQLIWNLNHGLDPYNVEDDTLFERIVAESGRNSDKNET